MCFFLNQQNKQTFSSMHESNPSLKDMRGSSSICSKMKTQSLKHAWMELYMVEEETVMHTIYDNDHA